MLKMFRAVKQAATDFIGDDCMSSGAAMAYYAIFSMPPLLVLVFLAAGWFGVSQQRIDQVVEQQTGIAPKFAQSQEGGPTDSQNAAEDGTTSAKSNGEEARGFSQIAQRDQASQSENVNWFSRVIGVGLLLFSATGLFAQLQYALNRAWEVEPDPAQGGVIQFVLKRILSFGMIIVIAFLLLISLVVTTLIDNIIEAVQGSSPGEVALVIGTVLNTLAVFALATLLFAAMFKILPDARIAWRDTWVGAGLTALLFVIGKSIIAWYLQSSDVGASWGSAAASLIGVLIWVYYSSLIVLFGAELTQVWATEYGSGIEPVEGAVRKVEAKHHIRESAA